MNRYRLGFTLWGGGVCAYLCLSVFGQSVRLRYLAAVIATLCVLVWLLSKRVAQKTRLKALAVSFSTLLCLLIVDVGYSLYLSRITRRQETPIDHATAQDALRALPLREIDGVVVFKPNVSFSATIVGNLHSLAPPDILSPRRVTYRIDDVGFRESTPISDAGIFAVGDSFTFGDGVDSPDTWIAGVESLTERGVYNIGFPGSGPSDSILRLQYAVRVRGATPPVIVWMLFEGNDFDDQHFARPETSQVDATLLDSAIGIIESVRRNSVISRALSGRLYVASGERSLFSSATLGLQCIHPNDIRSAQMESVSELPSVEAAFADLKRSAENSRVIVVIAPSAAHVYEKEFQGLKVSHTRPFAEWLVQHARTSGFEIVDLYPHFVEQGHMRLLYHTDDTHWNPAGHALAAQLIADHIEQSLPE